MSKTKTPVGLTYVKDFEFPEAQGFTGSAGRQPVKGYMRGGKVRRPRVAGKGKHVGGPNPGKEYPPSKAHQKMPSNVKMKGGKVHAQAGGYMGPDREISVDDVEISVPRARGGSMHDKLVKHGKKMGYAYGGRVKRPGSKSIGQTPDDIGLKNYKTKKNVNTSSEFKMKKGKAPDMDHGVQPARRGTSQQEVEAGGNRRLKPGYAKGGKAKAQKGGKRMRTMRMEPTAERKEAVGRVRKAWDRTKGKGMSKKGFPATVKAKGGLACAADRTKGKGMSRKGFPATVRAKGGRSC